jgi:hypothetical protein
MFEYITTHIIHSRRANLLWSRPVSHVNQASAQKIDPVFDASQAFIVEHVARNSNDWLIRMSRIAGSSQAN